jgi:hypothetical protein
MKPIQPNQTNTPADLHETPVFDLRGITYLPHYRNKDIYVGPGYPTHNMTRYSASELMLKGATPRVAMLWSRGTGGRVSDSNP